MSGSRAAVLKSEDGKITVPLPLGTTALGRTNLKLDDKRVSRTQGTPLGDCKVFLFLLSFILFIYIFLSIYDFNRLRLLMAADITLERKNGRLSARLLVVPAQHRTRTRTTAHAHGTLVDEPAPPRRMG